MGIDRNHKYFGNVYVKPRGRQNLQIEGFREAMKILDELPYKTKKKVIISILRKAVKPIVKEAQANVRNISDGTAKSIGSQLTRGSKLGIKVKPRTTGKYKDYGFKAHWIEFGTSGIISKPGRKNFKTSRADDNPNFAVWVGKKKKGERYRVDQPAKPFMRPAIAAKKEEVKKLMKKLITEDIDKTIQKFKK